MDDGLSLRLWRGCVDLQVPTHQVFKRLWAEQHLWDPTLERRRVVAEPDMHTQIYQYSTSAALLQASRDYCVLRCVRGCVRNCVRVDVSVYIGTKLHCVYSNMQHTCFCGVYSYVWTVCVGWRGLVCMKCTGSCHVCICYSRA